LAFRLIRSFTEEGIVTSRVVSRAQEVVVGLTAMSDDAKDGERLGQKEELRTTFGVSVGAFNEALKMAHDRGIIVVRRGPGGGIFAAKQTAMGRLAGELMTLNVEDPSVAEAFRMRNTLDPLLISDAIDHATMADIHQLRDIIREMQRAIQAEDPKAFHHFAMDYQRYLLNISPNSFLKPVLSTLFDIIERDAVPISTGRDKVTSASLTARLSFFIQMTNALESRNHAQAYDVMVESAIGSCPYLRPSTER
jgi:DNA-binding FadR family transcriptional regulator